MSTINSFNLLTDDDAVDPNATIAAAEATAATATATATATADATATTKAASKSATLPTQAVKARNEGGRVGRVYGLRRGGGGGQNRDKNGFMREVDECKPYEGRSGFDDSGNRGGRRGGFSNGDDERRPRRNYDRRSGTGRGSEIKRDGAGRGNWRTTTDAISPVVEEPVAENEVNVVDEKPGVEENVDAEKENTVNKVEEEPEEKQLTLAEYEKLLEEKRKELHSLSEERKGEERKISFEEFQSMLLVSKKKNDNGVFIKLGSKKEKSRESTEKEEKVKKTVSINEFLKAAEGEANYRCGEYGEYGRMEQDSDGEYGRMEQDSDGEYGRMEQDSDGRGGLYSDVLYHFINGLNGWGTPKIDDLRVFPILGGK